MAELLCNALVVRVAGLLSQRTYVPNVGLECFNRAELLQNAVVVRVAELFLQRAYVANVKPK